ncbi:hypothetical protein HXX76_006381 [Chlamydomonas incerta]|uniref:Uncharacterized protein n=1 Tax=Chlamydomonas incerta TaxID=51695 RepID=A0A835T3V2_CHLIN|nr:hypothetical protein HXX76_006381 [Chlamydomonas incerta]|eukprot:KAG2436861.1 hypothetical protein HXX76_006381 [Chlamydomonas incerta]
MHGATTLPECKFPQPGKPIGVAAELAELKDLVACGERSWAAADLVLDLGTKVGAESKQANSQAKPFSKRYCLYLISITPPGGRERPVYVGKSQGPRLLKYTSGWRGWLGPGEGEPHKQAAWWWAAQQGCRFKMRIVTSRSWDGDGRQLEKAEKFALSQADFAWNKTDNTGLYRMGRDFWRSVGLEPAEPAIKQMMMNMYKEAETKMEKDILATVGLPFDL